MRLFLSAILIWSWLSSAALFAEDEKFFTPEFLNAVVSAIRNNSPDKQALLSEVEERGRHWNAAPGELSEMLIKLAAAPFDGFLGFNDIDRVVRFENPLQREAFRQMARDVVSMHVLLDRESRQLARIPYGHPAGQTVSTIFLQADPTSLARAERRFGRKLNLVENIGHEGQHAIDTHDPRLYSLWHSNMDGIFGLEHASPETFETRFRGNFSPGLVVLHKELRGYRTGFRMTQQNASFPTMLYGAIYSTAANRPDFTDSDHTRPLIFSVLHVTAQSLGRPDWKSLTVDEAIDGFETANFEQVMRAYEESVGGRLRGKDAELFEAVRKEGDRFFCVKAIKTTSKLASPKPRQYKKR